MIKIVKNPEPHEWTEYRKTPGAVYQSFGYLVKALLEEQGYICAYCMRRIPCKDKINGESTQEDHRIEHIKCRDNYPELQLDYTNMVICCPGHIGDESHCDRLKGNNPISFSPFDQAFIDTINYNADGEISSTNEQYNAELESVLNLNTSLLVMNRRAVITEVINQINAQKKNKPWNKSTLNKLITKYSSMQNMGEEMEYIPYCGIVLYYLRKKLKKLP